MYIIYIDIYLYIYICIYIYIRKTNFNVGMYVNALKHQKSHIFSKKIYFRTIFLRQCVRVCVKDTCWKFSICYKFTIKESLKLTKEITCIYIYIYTHTHTHIIYTSSVINLHNILISYVLLWTLNWNNFHVMLYFSYNDKFTFELKKVMSDYSLFHVNFFVMFFPLVLILVSK